MPNNKNYWSTTRSDGTYAVMREGAERATSIHSTQADAWAETQQRARNTGGEALLQNRHGQIRERNSYGNDDFPPKG